MSDQTGQQFVNATLKESGRPAMVTFRLGGIVSAACVVTTCKGIYKLISGIAEGKDILKFGTYGFECHV